jgi:hypothetical protein
VNHTKLKTFMYFRPHQLQIVLLVDPTKRKNIRLLTSLMGGLVWREATQQPAGQETAIKGATAMDGLMAMDGLTGIDSAMAMDAGWRWTVDGATAIRQR